MIVRTTARGFTITFVAIPVAAVLVDCFSSSGFADSCAAVPVDCLPASSSVFADSCVAVSVDCLPASFSGFVAAVDAVAAVSEN